MRHVWTVICSRAVVDRESNNVTLQNVLESIKISATPKEDGVLPLSMSVVSFWVRSEQHEERTGTFNLSFVSPSGKTLGEVDGDIDLSANERLRTIIQLQSLALPESGIYHFILRSKSKGAKRARRVAYIPLDVQFGPIGEQDP